MNDRRKAVEALGPYQTLHKAIVDDINPPPVFVGQSTKKAASKPSKFINDNVMVPSRATVYRQAEEAAKDDSPEELMKAQVEVWSGRKDAPFRILFDLELPYQVSDKVAIKATEAAVARYFYHCFGNTLHIFLHMVQVSLGDHPQWSIVAIPEYTRAVGAIATVDDIRCKKVTRLGKRRRADQGEPKLIVRLDEGVFLRQHTENGIKDWCVLSVEHKNDGHLS